MPATASHVTLLLRRWSGGDSDAFDQLVAILYERLRELARRRLRGETGSLNTTALVHEAYLKLAAAGRGGLRDREHFLALASRVMRQLLVDHARARKAVKRGAGAKLLPLDEVVYLTDQDLELISDLHRALERLERLDRRQCGILEQHYFGGLTLEETASALGISTATVKRELRSARAWLAQQLEREPA